MLPSVVRWVLKQVSTLSISQVEPVSSFEIDVGSKYKVVGIVVDVLFNVAISKVVGVSNILWNVGYMPETFNFISNIVVIFASVLPPVDLQALDQYCIVHVGFNLYWFSAICLQILLYHKLKTIFMELIQSIFQFGVEYFIAILL